MARRKKRKSTTGANLGFEEKLWQAADKLRSNKLITKQELVLRT